MVSIALVDDAEPGEWAAKPCVGDVEWAAEPCIGDEAGSDELAASRERPGSVIRKQAPNPSYSKALPNYPSNKP
jgi:hypothetical protein